MSDKELVFIQGTKDLLNDAPILIVIGCVIAFVVNFIGKLLEVW